MIVNSEIEMIALGNQLANHLYLGDVICLYGDLGVGKSALSRSIIRSFACDYKLEVPSPSFTIIQIYEFENVNIMHVDAYRLGGADELYELGFPECFNSNISLIEWPDRLGELTPDRRIDIHIKDLGAEKRQVNIDYFGDWTWRI